MSTENSHARFNPAYLIVTFPATGAGAVAGPLAFGCAGFGVKNVSSSSESNIPFDAFWASVE